MLAGRKRPAPKRMIHSDGYSKCKAGHTVGHIMKLQAHTFCIIFLAAALGAPANAQTEPSPSPSPSPSGPADPCTSILAIVTRPTVTTSVCTVRPRKALIETGYTNTVTTGQGSGITASYPQALLRFGSGYKNFEYEFTPPSVNATNFNSSIVRGATDMGAGLKYVLGYSDKWAWGVNASFTVPSGSPAFTAGLAQYTGNFNWGYAVNSTVAVSGTLGFNDFAGFDSSGNNGHFFSFIPSVVVTVAYPQNSQFFAEYVFFSQSGLGLGGRSLIDYGFVHDFGAHIQVDIESGVQPTTINGQRQHYVGAGLSLMN